MPLGNKSPKIDSDDESSTESEKNILSEKESISLRSSDGVTKS